MKAQANPTSPSNHNSCPSLSLFEVCYAQGASVYKTFEHRPLPRPGGGRAGLKEDVHSGAGALHSSRSRQVKAPVLINDFGPGPIKIFDGVVPELCPHEMSRWDTLWVGRIINAENSTVIEQGRIISENAHRAKMNDQARAMKATANRIKQAVVKGHKEISDTQHLIKKIIDAQPMLKDSYNAREALLEAATMLDGLHSQLQQVGQLAQKPNKLEHMIRLVEEIMLSKIEKACKKLDVRLHDKLLDIAARGQVEGWHKSLVCPLSMELMRDPVVAADGYTYERGLMEELIAKQSFGDRCDVLSPQTNEALAHLNLISNTTLRTLIKEHVDAATHSMRGGDRDHQRDRVETKRQLQTAQNDLAR